jgi:hypothetical protein
MAVGLVLTTCLWLGCQTAGIGPEGGASIDESAPVTQQFEEAIVEETGGDTDVAASDTDTAVDTVAKKSDASLSKQACLVKFAVFKFLKGAGYKDFAAFTVHGGKDLRWFYESAKSVFEEMGYDMDKGFFPWDKVVQSVYDMDAPVIFVTAKKSDSDNPLVFIAGSSDLTTDKTADFTDYEMAVVWDRKDYDKPTGSDYENNYTLYDTDFDLFYMKGSDEEVAAFKADLDVTNIVSSWKYESMCSKVCSCKDAITQDVFLSTSLSGKYAAADLYSFGKSFSDSDLDKAYCEICYSKKDDVFRYDNSVFTYDSDYDLTKSISEAAVFSMDADYSYDAVKYDAARFFSGAFLRKAIDKEELESATDARASDQSLSN